MSVSDFLLWLIFLIPIKTIFADMKFTDCGSGATDGPGTQKGARIFITFHVKWDMGQETDRGGYTS